MREIKFRAWDKKANHMVCWEDISRTNILGMLVNNNNRDDSRGILMQFTGLLDKQGVEIYEGDILKDYDQDYIGVVSFQDGAFIVTWENEFCNAFEWSGEEVIGNIYENPELLQPKHKGE